MAIVINGDGSISGISAGGLPDGSVASDTLATGIDVTKLADGTITNSELQYINSLSSNAQTQIDGAGSPFELITHESTEKTSGIQLDFGDVSITTSSPTRYAHATVTFNTAFSAIWAIVITGVSRISSTQCYGYSRSHSTTTLDVSVYNGYDTDSRTYEMNWIAIGAKA